MEKELRKAELARLEVCACMPAGWAGEWVDQPCAHARRRHTHARRLQPHAPPLTTMRHHAPPGEAARARRQGVRFATTATLVLLLEYCSYCYLLVDPLVLLLATHDSRLTTHHSPLTTHFSLLTTHHSLLTTHYSPLSRYALLEAVLYDPGSIALCRTPAWSNFAKAPSW